MRTKQEIINFLESKLGTKVPCVGSPSLDGQCVTLIKSLMDFLGVKDPYKARGHGKDAINSYLKEGIADKGLGFISVFSNKNMGGGYGHIWCNAGEGNGTYYESNGVKPLICTKGKTYSYDKVCNFDRYIKQQQKEDNMNELLQYLDVKNLDEAKAKLKEHLGEMNGKCGWGSDRNMGYLGSERDNNQRLNLEVSKLNHEILKVTTENNQFNNANIDLQVKLTTLKQEHERLQLSYADLIRSIEENSNEYIKLKLAYEKLAQELEECQNIGNNESELKAKYDTLNKECERLKSRILELENIIKENCNFMSQAKCKLEKLKQAVIDFINEIIDNIKKSDR